MELLVAAVLVLVSVVAVVSVVRKSTDMQIVDNNRRQARAVIVRHFETTFSHLRFSTDTPPRYTVTIERPEALGNDTTFNVIADNNFLPAQPVRFVLNEGSGGQLIGNISFRVRDTVEVVTMSPGIGETQNVTAHKIAARVTWQEIDGTPDTIILIKRLAAIHD